MVNFYSKVQLITFQTWNSAFLGWIFPKEALFMLILQKRADSPDILLLLHFQNKKNCASNSVNLKTSILYMEPVIEPQTHNVSCPLYKNSQFFSPEFVHWSISYTDLFSLNGVWFPFSPSSHKLKWNFMYIGWTVIKEIQH